jgi:hypothetical protein
MIIKRSVPWHARSTLSRSAHVIARIGFALTGIACGLFVAQVSARIDLVGSVEAMLAMMLYGAAGFYLGIDLPQAPPDHHMHLPPRRGLGTSADMLELLTAASFSSPRWRRWCPSPVSFWVKPWKPAQLGSYV